MFRSCFQPGRAAAAAPLFRATSGSRAPLTRGRLHFGGGWKQPERVDYRCGVISTRRAGRLTALSLSLPLPAEAGGTHGGLGGPVRVGGADDHLRAGRAGLLPALGAGDARLPLRGCRRTGTPGSRLGARVEGRRCLPPKPRGPEAWCRALPLPSPKSGVHDAIGTACGPGGALLPQLRSEHLTAQLC